MTSLSFYAALLDQMDLALEHLDKGSVHDGDVCGRGRYTTLTAATDILR